MIRSAVAFLILAVTAVTISCAVDVDATSSTEQELGGYCYDGGRPFICYPWDWDGDWNYCQRSCAATEGTDGYCPEATSAEYAFCADSANWGSRYCNQTIPQFPHYCVSGEFPVAPPAD